MPYQLERYFRTVEDAPTITEDDLLSMGQAAELLNVTTQTVDYYIRTGALSAVTKPGKVTSYGRARRWVLKSEVLAMPKAQTASATA
jgi:hypothetical protein